MNTRHWLGLLAIVLGVMGAGCSDASQSARAAEEKDDAANTTQILLDPNHDRFQQTAPDSFRARFSTSKGDFIVLVEREWAPRGADRFYNLANNGYFK